MKNKKRHVGVKLRGRSIQLQFCYKSEVIREQIARRPDETDTQSLDYGEAFRKKVLDAIVIDERGGKPFRFSDFFPDSKRNVISGALAIPVSQALTEWFEKTEKDRSPRTNRKYKREMQEFINRWGELTVDQMTPGKIELWVEHARTPKSQGGAGRSAKTVKNMLRILRGMFQRAKTMRAEWGLTKDWVSPMLDISPVEETRTEIGRRRLKNDADPFSFSEMVRVIHAARGQEQNLIKALFGSGMRPDEGFGVAWEDMDLVAHKAALKRGWVEKELSAFLKTEASIRELDLNKLPLALEGFLAQKQHTYMLAAVNYKKFATAEYEGDAVFRFIFMNSQFNRPWMHDQEFRRGPWGDILRRAGVRYRPPYQMRHTFAVLSLSAGDSDQWLAGVLGHTSTRMLQEHYARNMWDTEIAELAKRYGVKGFAEVWRRFSQDPLEQQRILQAA
jgi:integrase